MAQATLAPPTDRMPLISARDLTKRYPGVQALDNLTLGIEPGIIGFVGANGAGKSTFIRILLGLLAPTSGSVSVLDMDVAQHAMAVRRSVGYMPEHDCLPVDVSGTDFVAHMGQMSGLPFAAARERAAEVLRHVGLHEERYRLIGSYSTGMKQRIKLAQALVHDPKLLLLDEPTTGLDPAGMRDMRELVKRLASDGITILLSSHILAEVEELCNRVAIIRKGRIIYEGLLHDLLASAGGGYRLNATEPERARTVLLTHGIDGVQLVDGELRFQADEDVAAAVTIALGQAGIGISALVPQTATLEELFLGMTEQEAA